MDCFGDCYGDAFFDDCGICSGGNSGHFANSDMDCEYVCFGDSFWPECIGCTDDYAVNTGPGAIIDDGSCIYPGDVNWDGFVDVEDLLLLIEIYMNDTVPTPNQLLTGDFWIDGWLDILDLVYIVSIILGDPLPSMLPVTFADLIIENGVVRIEADGSIAGIQLDLSGIFSIEILNIPDGWHVVHDDSKFLMFSLDGSSLEQTDLFAYSGELNVDGGLVADWHHTAVYINSKIIPDQFAITSAYPNPFNPVTTIQYGLPEAADVWIVVYDMLGRQVAELSNGYQSAGNHLITWDAADQSSGIYIIMLKTGKTTSRQKVVLMK